MVGKKETKFTRFPLGKVASVERKNTNFVFFRRHDDGRFLPLRADFLMKKTINSSSLNFITNNFHFWFTKRLRLKHIETYQKGFYMYSGLSLSFFFLCERICFDLASGDFSR